METELKHTRSSFGEDGLVSLGDEGWGSCFTVLPIEVEKPGATPADATNTEPPLAAFFSSISCFHFGREDCALCSGASSGAFVPAFLFCNSSFHCGMVPLVLLAWFKTEAFSLTDGARLNLLSVDVFAVC